METAKIAEVYSLMIPIIEQSILLPNVTVVEIVPFSDVELAEDKPKWFVGYIMWRNQKVPMVSLDVLKGAADSRANKRSRVALVRTLNSNAELPYLAIIVQGIPRLTHVTEPSITTVEDYELGPVEKLRVAIGAIQATIPDLDKLEAMILESSQ